MPPRPMAKLHLCRCDVCGPDGVWLSEKDYLAHRLATRRKANPHLPTIFTPSLVSFVDAPQQAFVSRTSNQPAPSFHERRRQQHEADMNSLLQQVTRLAEDVRKGTHHSVEEAVGNPDSVSVNTNGKRPHIGMGDETVSKYRRVDVTAEDRQAVLDRSQSIVTDALSIPANVLPLVRKQIARILSGIRGWIESYPKPGPISFDSSHHFDYPIDRLALHGKLEVLDATLLHLSDVSRSDIDRHLIIQNASKQLAGLDIKVPDNLASSLAAFRPYIPWKKYQVCPKCHANYELYQGLPDVEPSHHQFCSYVGPDTAQLCGEPMLDEGGKPRCLLWYHPIIDFIASLLADPEIEQLVEATTKIMQQGAHPGQDEFVKDIIHSKLVRELTIPGSTQPFIHGSAKALPIMLNLFIDFFNARGGRIRGKTVSTGIIAAHCVNLPGTIRHLFPHICMLIQGPLEPDHAQLQHYIKILVDDLEKGVGQGFHISRTAAHETGRDVAFTCAVKIADLVANKASQGHVNQNARIFCDKCNCWEVYTTAGTLCKVKFEAPDGTVMKHWKELLGRTDHENWQARDCQLMNQFSTLSRTTPSAAVRHEIQTCQGLRWTEWARLGYFDSVIQAPIEVEHALHIGAVQWLSRKCLRMTDADAERRPGKEKAFELEPFDMPASIKDALTPLNHKHLARIRNSLMTWLDPDIDDDDDDDDDTRNDYITIEQLKGTLMGCSRVTLEIALGHLVLRRGFIRSQPLKKSDDTKELLVHDLCEWRLDQPLDNTEYMPGTTKLVTPKVMAHIRWVILSILLPSWFERPPSAFGAARTGTLKAVEWMSMIQLILPLALGTLWHPASPMRDRDAAPYAQEAFDNLMHLAQASILCYKNVTSQLRADRFREHYANFIRTLTQGPLNCYGRRLVPNLHACFHIYESLLNIGPARVAHCLPFERLIGMLQKFKTNSKLGQLEHTLHEKMVLKIKVIKWLLRLVIPAHFAKLRSTLVQKYRRYMPKDDDELTDQLLEKTFSANRELHVPASRPTPAPEDLAAILPPFAHGEVQQMAHLAINGRQFWTSRSKHEGSSHIMYRPCGSHHETPAKIKYIVHTRGHHFFAVNDVNLADPEYCGWQIFAPYVDFRALLVKKRLGILKLVEVTQDSNFAHYAQLQLDDDHNVIVQLSAD